jgi:hypothetical protein
MKMQNNTTTKPLNQNKMKALTPKQKKKVQQVCIALDALIYVTKFN